MKKNKEVFTVKTEDGELELAAVRPTPKQTIESQRVYNKTYALGKRDKYLFRDELWDAMREQGLWSEEKEQTYGKIAERLNENIDKLNKGGITKKEGKDLAIQVKIDRMLLQQLLSDRNEMDAVTVEGTADNARFDYLVSVCIVYNKDGQPYFTGLEDYISKSSESSSIKAANVLAALVNDADVDYQGSLPENKFLKRFGYVNDEYRLVNKDGHLIDTLGRLIDSSGELVNDEGKRIDEDGNLVVETTVEDAVFLDDEEVKVEEVTTEEGTTKVEVAEVEVEKVVEKVAVEEEATVSV